MASMMYARRSLLALALVLLLPVPGRAELRRIDIRIFGMD
jgi:hypothetical protein